MIRAVALMWVLNELDILPWSVEHLLNQGIDVWIQDNYSTDGSYEWACDRQRTSLSRLAVTRWPESGPTETTSWRQMLEHSAQRAVVAKRSGYDWILHHDADELRWSARESESLLTAIDRLDGLHFNAIDHVVEVYKFRPGWPPNATTAPQQWFTERVPTHLDQKNGQIKIWRQPSVTVDLASSGGHQTAFPGRWIAPERFRLQHFPLRTPAQVRAKLERDARRWAKSEKQAGWHVSYTDQTLQALGVR